MLRAEVLRAMKAETSRVAEKFEHEKSSLGGVDLQPYYHRGEAHTTTEGKLAHELEITKANSQKTTSDPEKSKDDLARVQSRLEGCMVEKDDLYSRLSMAENSATTAVEDFKVSPEYLKLLKGNTATLLRGFCQTVSHDFPGISFDFKKYVTDLGEDYVVELFDDHPDDEDEDMGVEEGEDEVDEDEDDEDDD
ncbi:hypothetical protein LIER_01930 [Lithospermum erythrorhizon]|uniref:Uncharacterized protein n=1 Tax=Lithospermum erythrorhizon TaxID=34254 RepID=A0AAV3NMS7_LITER